MRRLIGAAALALISLGAAAQTQSDFIRGIWLNRHLMAEGEEAIVSFLDDCHARGITHIMPNFWFHGYLIYPGSEMAPQHPDFVGWDPMEVVVREAHSRGMRVLPWGEYGFFTHFNRTLDEDDCGWILTEHPEWRTADAEGHVGLHNEGLGVMHFSMNPAHPGARSFLIDLHLDVAARYDVDGINLDRIRFMGEGWGHDAFSEAAFASDPRVDSQAEGAFGRWRELILLDFMAELSARWRAAYPELPITAAVAPPYLQAEKSQNWHEWVAAGHLDLPVIMLYGDAELVRTQLGLCRDELPEGAPLLAGLDAGRGDESLAAQVAVAQEMGAAGVVIWDDTTWRGESFSFAEPE